MTLQWWNNYQSTKQSHQLQKNSACTEIWIMSNHADNISSPNVMQSQVLASDLEEI